MPIKKQISKQDDERLSQLIRLKRIEKPDEAFWDQFDESLRSKQLSALVETHTWYARTGKLSMLLAKKSAAVVATTGALAITFLAINPLEFTESDSKPASTDLTGFALDIPEQETPLFVVESSADTDVLAVENDFPTQIQDLGIPATYGLNIFSSDKSESKFKLNTMPKTLTTHSQSDGFSQPHFGAKIIRVKPAN